MADSNRQEANSALLVIDKGLKSHQLGEQCEAIVRFPALMDKFPFPVMIDVAYLRLADTFRTENNLLRLNILKVIEISRKHLHKINSKEEFFKRIYSVIHSNDPIARSLTLRLFASIATIIADKKAVHHSVWRGLESNDHVEVEAAIIATESLCQHSGDFATGVYDKIAAIVQGLRVPPEMKLKVIPVLKTMNHNLTIAKQVRDVCMQLLQSHPSTPFINIILKTLTELSLSVLIQIPDHIVLLLDYTAQDVRKAVRLQSLRELYRISLLHPQSWDIKIIERLVQIVSDSKYDSEKGKGCKILHKLSSTPLINEMTIITESLKSLSCSHSPIVSSYALATLINLSTNIMGGINNNEYMMQVIELILVIGNRDKEVIKVLLDCLMKLSGNSNIEVDVLKILISQLSSLPGDCNSSLCKTISIINNNNKDTSLTSYIIELLNGTHDDHAVFSYSLMLLELHKGTYSSYKYQYFINNIQSVLLHRLWRLSDKNKYWNCYKIAQRASKIGFHSFAESVYENLSEKVTDIKFKGWLQCLYQFSHSQSLLSSFNTKTESLIEQLHTSSSLLYDSSLLIKCTGQSGPLHSQYIPIIASLIDTYSQLLSLCISPIYTNTVYLNRKMKDTVIQLQSVAKTLSSLAVTLFDADPYTLQYIISLQQSCTLLVNIITTLLLTSSSSGQTPLLSPGTPVVAAAAGTPLTTTMPHSLEDTCSDFNTTYLIGTMCNSVLARAQSAAVRLRNVSLNSEHLSVIKESTLDLLSVPLLLPPSFFVSYQSTNVQLVITPSPSTASVINVVIDSQFALKVEGVIEHRGQRIYRSPVSVYIKVFPKVKKLFDTSLKHPKLQELEITSKIKNDYFVGEFLLTFPSPGQYTLSIETSLMDNDGQTWNTGPQVEVAIVTDTEDKLKVSTGGGGVGGGVTGNDDNKPSKTPKW